MVDYIAFPTDPQMTNMNRGLYQYMEGMREIYLQTPQIFTTLLNNLNATNKKGIVVTNFLNHYGLCKQTFNTKLDLLCPERPNGTDHATSIALELMNYKGTTQYQPVMELFNGGGNCGNPLLDMNSGFRMALGTDAPESNNNGNGNATGQGKLIPCWQFKKNGQIQLELISENQAKNSNIPVFIFTPGLVKNGTTQVISPEGYVWQMANINDGSGGIYTGDVISGGCAGSGGGGSGGGSGTGGTGGGSGSNVIVSGDVIWNGMNISQHHEAYGASEVYRNTFALGAGVGIFTALVPVNVVNCTCYTSLGIKVFTGTTNATNIQFITYEYDWYSGIKYILVPNPGSAGGTPFQYEATLASDIYNVHGFNIGTSPLANSFVTANGVGYIPLIYNGNQIDCVRY